jgi:photosystem II stability/assembly factor-like uncharacterized protein
MQFRFFFIFSLFLICISCCLYGKDKFNPYVHSKVKLPRPLCTISQITNCNGTLFIKVSNGRLDNYWSHGCYLYRSVNGGKSWKKENRLGDSVYDIASVGNVILVHTGDHSLFRSTDLGKSWKRIPSLRCDRFYWMNSNLTSFFAWGDSGMFRSKDNGNSWVKIHMGIRYPSNYGKIIVGETGSFMYLSTDEGNTWETIKASKSWYDYKVFEHTIFRTKSSATIKDTNIIDRSTDFGRTWSKAGDIGHGHLINKIGNTLYANSDSGLLYSINDGISWTLTNFFQNSSVSCMSAFDTFLICGTLEEGCFQSNNKDHDWKHLDTATLPAIPLKIVSMANYDSAYLVIRAFSKPYISVDNGISWKSFQTPGISIKKVVSDDKSFFCLNGRHNRTIPSTGSDGPIFRTQDFGKSWIDVSDKINHFVLLESHAGLIYGADYTKGLYRYDSGKDWSQLNDHKEIHTLVFLDSTILESSEPAGKFSGYFTIYCSVDNGKTWTTPDIKFKKGYLNIFKSGRNLFIASPSGLFISLDKGISWRRCLEKGIPNEDFSKSVPLDTLLFTVSDEKLYRSSDYGETWKLVKAVIGSVEGIYLEGEAITIDTEENIYFHSIDGGKTWEREKHQPRGGIF